MAWTIKGRIESEESSDSTMLAQCRIEVLFEQKAPAGSEVPPVPKKISEISRRFLGPSNEPLNRTDSTPPSAEAVTIRARVSTRPDESGNFEVTLPDKAELASRNLRFVVLAPSGETFADKSVDVDTIGELIPIQVPKVAPIQQPKDLPKAETRRNKGKVIERNCKPLPSCLQILLFACKRGEENTETVGEDSQVFVARADSSGYFFGDAPNVEYEHAVALSQESLMGLMLHLRMGLSQRESYSS